MYAFTGDYNKGHGLPVDIIDGICMDLSNGYECLRSDFPVEFEHSAPWHTNYNSPPRTDIDACFARNTDAYTQQVCAVESTMIDAIFRTFITGSTDINLHDYADR